MAPFQSSLSQSLTEKAAESCLIQKNYFPPSGKIHLFNLGGKHLWMSPQPFKTLAKFEISKKETRRKNIFVRHKHLDIVLKGKAIYLASLLSLCSIKMPGSILRLCAKITSFAGGDDDNDDDNDYDIYGEDADDDDAQK